MTYPIFVRLCHLPVSPNFYVSVRFPINGTRIKYVGICDDETVGLGCDALFDCAFGQQYVKLGSYSNNGTVVWSVNKRWSTFCWTLSGWCRRAAVCNDTVKLVSYAGGHWRPGSRSRFAFALRHTEYFVRPCSVNSSTLEEELFVKTINWSKPHLYVAWVMLACVHSRRGPAQTAILPSPQHV
jgi:hypothetical protein